MFFAEVLRLSEGEGDGNPLQYSCLENPLDRGVWRATVPEITELDMTELLTQKLRYLVQVYSLSAFPLPAGRGMGQAASGRQDGSSPLPPSLLEFLGPQCLQQLALDK